jgi:protein TonB
MFDAIGRNTDDEFLRRRAAALTITLLGTGAAVGLAIGVMAYTAVETALDPIVDEPMVELVTDMALPDEPPPPPPPAGRADASEIDEQETEFVPEEVVDEVAELDDTVPDEISSSSAPAGVPGGVDGGVPGGVPHGVLGGDGDVFAFHASELAVKKRIYPRYPESARELNLGDQRCRAVVLIDEEGVPYDVTVEDCPKVFEMPTREAMFQWRWYPPKAGGRRVKARTTIAVTYRLH